MRTLMEERTMTVAREDISRHMRKTQKRGSRWDLVPNEQGGLSPAGFRHDEETRRRWREQKRRWRAANPDWEPRWRTENAWRLAEYNEIHDATLHRTAGKYLWALRRRIGFKRDVLIPQLEAELAELREGAGL